MEFVVYLREGVAVQQVEKGVEDVPYHIREELRAALNIIAKVTDTELNSASWAVAIENQARQEDLSRYCKENGMPKSGAKIALITRIIDKLVADL